MLFQLYRFYTLVLTVTLLFGDCHSASFQEIGQGIADVGKSAKDVSIGVAKDVINSIPSPQQIFESSKNALLAFPIEVIFSAVNQLCSSALSSQAVKPRETPDLQQLHFQFHTICSTYNYSILEFNRIVNNPEFDPKKPVVILATGWRTTINDSSTIVEFAKAFNCRGDSNFVAVDAAYFVDTLYTWSALNTDEIGANIAEGLVLLTEIIPIENIHLMGHSLGSHIMGAAGRHFYYKTGKLIPRITALDPAKPCFNEGESLSGIMRGDAEFVDVIHSDPGILGKRDPTGDVDFYPGGLGPLPKGCYDMGCAHSRSWQYYAETIYPGNEFSFMAVRCNSLTQLQQNKCPGVQVPMGYATPTNLKGNYFLEVNAESPFGKQSSAELLELQKNCGLCQKA
ncbi:vitellogenin-1-like [Eurosta solidaginis]|uniref:vitellogenin-1-like n=1 Tax=Eurosta solidaginis TaxID=178769 RepID=UPI003530C987